MRTRHISIPKTDYSGTDLSYQYESPTLDELLSVMRSLYEEQKRQFTPEVCVMSDNHFQSLVKHISPPPTAFEAPSVLRAFGMRIEHYPTKIERDIRVATLIQENRPVMLVTE